MDDTDRGQPPDQPLDYDDTSGAVTNSPVDADTPVEHTDSDTRTTFDPQDAAQGDYTKWRALRARQEQVTATGSTRRKADQRRDAATFCDRLNVAAHHRDRVLYWLDRIDVDDHGPTSEAVTLALIELVLNADGQSARMNGVDGPQNGCANELPAQQDTSFMLLQRRCEVPMRTVNAARQSLRGVLPDTLFADE